MWFLDFLLTILLIDILVILHEGGHYLVGKLCGITVLEFSVGMGPAIFSKVSKKSNVKYSLRAIPFGGYVMFDSESEESENPNAFTNKNVWARLGTVLAGPVANIIFGFIAMFVLVCITIPASTTVAEFNDGSLSKGCGLEEGDRIVAVENVNVHTGAELMYEIVNQGFNPLDLTVVRNGETLVLENVKFPTEEESGVTFGSLDFKLYREKKTFGSIVKQSFFRTLSTEKMILDSLADLLRGRFGIDSLSSPVGISSTVGAAAKSGFAEILYLMCILSINLGILNVLPLPALDGGRILFLLVEAVTRRKLNPKVEYYINTAGIIILFGFMILLVTKDIFALF